MFWMFNELQNKTNFNPYAVCWIWLLCGQFCVCCVVSSVSEINELEKRKEFKIATRAFCNFVLSNTVFPHLCKLATLRPTKMFVWSHSFLSSHTGSPCVHFSAVAVTLNPCLNRSFGEARAYLSHLSGSNYPSGLNNCSIVPLSHVIFDAVFLPWRKWRGDFVGMEISGIKPFVLGDHSLPPQPFMELEDI